MDDDDEGRVKELLEQCVDHAALRLSTQPSDPLDADLLARLQRLKAAPLAPNPAVAPHLHADGLQSDLSDRLAALKKNPSKPPPPDIITTAKLSHPNPIAHEIPDGDACEVEKLLQSVQDSVRLEKSSMPGHIHDGVASKSNHNNDSDDEVSESEVDHIVEWAKDAAALEEDEEDVAVDVELPTTPPTAADSPQRKRKGSRWKFW